MRKTILLIMALCLLSISTGCGLFTKSKPAIVKLVGSNAQKLAVKNLNCETGNAVKEDFERYTAKLLKVKTDIRIGAMADGQPLNESKELSSSSWASELCSKAAYLALTVSGSWMEGKLPETWQDDSCSLDKPIESLIEISNKLCGKLDKTVMNIRYKPKIEYRNQI